MKPLRMCMVCRQRREKSELIRIVSAPPNGAALDPNGRMPGRGGYLCRSLTCIGQAQKRRALERAFSHPIAPEAYARLLREAEACLEEDPR